MLETSRRTPVPSVTKTGTMMSLRRRKTRCSIFRNCGCMRLRRGRSGRSKGDSLITVVHYRMFRRRVPHGGSDPFTTGDPHEPSGEIHTNVDRHPDRTAARRRPGESTGGRLGGGEEYVEGV